MLYLGNPCGPEVKDAMRAGLIGFIDTPRQGNKRPEGVPWCADNGCYSDKWDQEKWWKWLVRHAGDAGTCLFAVAPDVVGDAVATLERSSPWLAPIRDLGYPVAFVAQDGVESTEVPWDAFDVLFVGGTDAFKLGPVAREYAHAAKLRGKRVHVGRVNSRKRFDYARRPYPFGLGGDTADGTKLTFNPTEVLPLVVSWRTDEPADLFGHSG